MLTLMLLAELVSGQFTPCGSRNTPCYVWTDRDTRMAVFDADGGFYVADTVAESEIVRTCRRDLEHVRAEREETKAAMVGATLIALAFGVLLLAGGIALRTDFLAAWRRSERRFGLPPNMRVLGYIFLTPALAMLLSIGLIRAAELLLNTQWSEHGRDWFIGLFFFGGVLFGIGAGTNVNDK